MSADQKKQAPAKAERSAGEKAPELKAKKAFVICHNGYLREIQPGDDLSDVPGMFHENLRTEGVI